MSQLSESIENSGDSVISLMGILLDKYYHDDYLFLTMTEHILNG